MRNTRNTTFSLLFLLTITLSQFSSARHAIADSISNNNQVKFLRLNSDSNGAPLALETSITRYVTKSPSVQNFYVDLIGAVHVGDSSYYKQLNEIFRQYDALLYELVAPEGQTVPSAQLRSDSPISFVQSGMKNLLELDFQLESIDYTKSNFVHADLSPERLFESFRKREGGFGAMLLRIFSASYAKQQSQENKGNELGLLLALLDPNRALALKRILAREFDNLDDITALMSGPNGSTLITERNKVAINVLKKQISLGKKRIGIFYGAAHMPDMERQLLEHYTLERSNQQWLEAWSLTP